MRMERKDQELDREQRTQNVQEAVVRKAEGLYGARLGCRLMVVRRGDQRLIPSLVLRAI